MVNVERYGVGCVIGCDMPEKRIYLVWYGVEGR